MRSQLQMEDQTSLRRSSRLAKTAPQRFRLFDLPPELRKEIYEMVLQQHETIRQRRRPTHGRKSRIRALTQTSRLLRKESFNISFAVNTFELDVSDGLGTAMKWIHDTDSGGVSKIRRMDIECHYLLEWTNPVRKDKARYVATVSVDLTKPVETVSITTYKWEIAQDSVSDRRRLTLDILSKVVKAVFMCEGRLEVSPRHWMALFRIFRLHRDKAKVLDIIWSGTESEMRKRLLESCVHERDRGPLKT